MYDSYITHLTAKHRGLWIRIRLYSRQGGQFAHDIWEFSDNWGYTTIWPADLTDSGTVLYVRIPGRKMLPLAGFPREGTDEGPGQPNGQDMGTIAIWNLGGDTYMWYTATLNGIMSPFFYYVKLAIYPGTALRSTRSDENEQSHNNKPLKVPVLTGVQSFCAFADDFRRSPDHPFRGRRLFATARKSHGEHK